MRGGIQRLKEERGKGGGKKEIREEKKEREEEKEEKEEKERWKGRKGRKGRKKRGEGEKERRGKERSKKGVEKVSIHHVTMVKRYACCKSCIQLVMYTISDWSWDGGKGKRCVWCTRQ